MTGITAQMECYQSHIHCFLLLFLRFLTNHEATGTNTNLPPRGGRQNVPQTPGYDTGRQSMRNPSYGMPADYSGMPQYVGQEDHMGSSYVAQPSNPFLAIPGTAQQMPMVPQEPFDNQRYYGRHGGQSQPVQGQHLYQPVHDQYMHEEEQVQQMYHHPQHYGQSQGYNAYNTAAAALHASPTQYSTNQIDQLYEPGPTNEPIGSASFNGERRHNTLNEWSSATTYDQILIQQQKMGHNFGDYEGEITLDFEYMRPSDMDEEEEETEKEDEKEEEEEKAQRKTDEKEIVGQTESIDRQTDTAENSEVGKEKEKVKVKRLLKKFEKKETEKVTKLKQYLDNIDMCERKKSDECWMQLFDALVALDDEERYDTMRQYCSENKRNIGYCNDSNRCDDIEKVIVFKKKTEEDDVILEEEEDEDEEKNDIPEEKPSPVQKVPSQSKTTDTPPRLASRAGSRKNIRPQNNQPKPNEQQINVVDPQYHGQSRLQNSSSYNQPAEQYNEQTHAANQQITQRQHSIQNHNPQLPQPSSRLQQGQNIEQTYTVNQPITQRQYPTQNHNPQIPQSSSRLQQGQNIEQTYANQQITQRQYSTQNHNPQLPQSSSRLQQGQNIEQTYANQQITQRQYSTQNPNPQLPQPSSRLQQGQNMQRRQTIDPNHGLIGERYPDPAYHQPNSPYVEQLSYDTRPQRPFNPDHHASMPPNSPIYYDTHTGASPSPPAVPRRRHNPELVNQQAHPPYTAFSVPNEFAEHSQHTRMTASGPPNNSQYGRPTSQASAYDAPQRHPEPYGSPQRHPESYGSPQRHPPESYGSPRRHPESYGSPQRHSAPGPYAYEDGSMANYDSGRRQKRGGDNKTWTTAAKSTTGKPSSAGRTAGPVIYNDFAYSDDFGTDAVGTSNLEKKKRTPEDEHMSKHLKMYMLCIKELLTHKLKNYDEEKVSKSFRQLLYGVMLPKPVFLAQQLNMALNGTPNEDIDIAELMLAPAFTMVNPFKLIPHKFKKKMDGTNMEYERLEMEEKVGVGQKRPMKQDIRVLLEIAGTQSSERLQQIRKITDALGYTKLADAKSSFINKQAATVSAREKIKNLLNWRLMGNEKEPKQLDNTLKKQIDERKNDAKKIYLAIKNNKTQELIQILVERSNIELLGIQKAFEALYGKTLKKYIRDHTFGNGDFRMLLLDLIDANRDEIYCSDTNMAKEDAITLYEAGVKIAGTHEGKFIRILANANLYHLGDIMKQYCDLPEKKFSELKSDIQKEFEDEKLRKALIEILDIAKQKWNSTSSAMREKMANNNKMLCPQYYITNKNSYLESNADAIYKAVDGKGCDPKAIIEVLVNQNNAQMRAITLTYNRKYYNDASSSKDEKDSKKDKPSNVKKICGFLTKESKDKKLRDRLKDELRGDMERLALDLLEGNRNEREPFEPNCERAEEQAAELLDPGNGPLSKLLNSDNGPLSKFAQLIGTKSKGRYFGEILANEHFIQIRLIIEMFNANNKGDSVTNFKNAITNYSKDIQVSQNVVKNKTVDSTVVKEAFKTGLHRIVDIAVKRVDKKELEKMMKSCEKLNENGTVENLSSSYFVTPAEKDASVLREAMKGVGTNEQALIWILVTRKNNSEIRAVYQPMYGKDLKVRITEETNGLLENDFQDALLQLLETTREDSTTFQPDKIKAKKQAVELYYESYKKEEDKETPAARFIKMMANIHLDQLLLVFNEYEKLYKIKNEKKLAPSTNYTFEELLKKKQEFSGDFLKTLLAIVSLARKGIDKAEFALEEKANKSSFFKKFWNYLVETYKGYKPVTEMEIDEFNKFVKLCDEDGAEGQACASTQKTKEIRELHENYFTKKITRTLKDMLGIFKMPSTKLKSKIDLHRLIISRYQHDLGDILRSIDRLSLKQIVDRFESSRLSFSGLLKGQLIEKEDKLYAHALKRLLNIENARKMVGYDEFLENYGKNLLTFMYQIDNDQYSFGIEMRRPKKGEDERISVNTHLHVLPLPPQKDNESPISDDEIQNQYKNISPKQLRNENNLSKYLSDSTFIHDLIQTMCQDLIDRLDLMYRGRFRKKILNKSDVKKFDGNIVGSPQFGDALRVEWKLEQDKPPRSTKQQKNEDETLKPWTIWGDTRNEDTRRKLTKTLYEHHVIVFKLLFWARLYALAIALQRVPVIVPNPKETDNEAPPTISKEEGAQLFGYNDFADIYNEPKETNAKAADRKKKKLFSRRTNRGIGETESAKKVVVYNDFANIDDVEAEDAYPPKSGKEVTNVKTSKSGKEAKNVKTSKSGAKESSAPVIVYNDFANPDDGDGDTEVPEDDSNDTTMSREMAPTFRLDIPDSAWPDETYKQKTEELRKKFESDMDVLEEFILTKFNHQMSYNENIRFYQVGYETLRKLGYEDLLHGKKLRTMLVHEMEEMLEEVDTGVNNDGDEDFSLKTVHFTKANVQLFKKGKNGTEQLSVAEKLAQKLFNWLDRRVDKCHRKALTKRNRMQRFLFDKLKTFTTELRGLFTGQQPAIKWVMKKCMPLLYYGGKYGMKLLKWVGRLFKPMIAWFKGSKDKMGYNHKKQRLESKKAMFGLLMEVDTAVQDNMNIKQKWREQGDQIWAEKNEKELEKIWAKEIEESKNVEQLEPDTFQQISGMMKEGNNMPSWMLKTPKDPKISKSNETNSNSVKSRGKRRTIRSAMNATKYARHRRRFLPSSDDAQLNPHHQQNVEQQQQHQQKTKQLFVDETHVRLKRKGAVAAAHASSRSSRAAGRAAYHSHYSAPAYAHGGSYHTAYHYNSSYHWYYSPPSPKQVLFEIWTAVNILVGLCIVMPIASALSEVDCSWPSYNHSSHSSTSYNYDYSTAQKLREKEEKKRLKRREEDQRRYGQETEGRRLKQKEDELDYEIAQWDKEIAYGSKGNNSTARRTKRSSSAADAAAGVSSTDNNTNNNTGWWWYKVENFGIKNDSKRRKKRAAGENCGTIMALMLLLTWLVAWIGGYFIL